MKFKIDDNLRMIASAMKTPTHIESVAVELCRHFINSGMIEETTEHWGESVLIATGPRYVVDVKNVLAGYLYNDESHSVPADVFNAFCGLTIVGDGDCPKCGGELIFDYTIGHETNDGDYFTPPSYVVDFYVYHCPVCGEIYKLSYEL